jgi:hypothetical protein
LVLAHATLEADEMQAIRWYELAADGFTVSREAEGEVVARQNLNTIYRRLGRRDDAARQVERAVAVADGSGNPLAIARASVLQAGDLIDNGSDVGRAYRVLQRAEGFAFPNGPIGLRRTILFNLANASL